MTESDDIAEEWKKDYGVTRIAFNTQNKYLDEWYAMSKCRHHIIANSTYSWWSSYISDSSDKIVKVPDIEEYLAAEKENTEEMYYNYHKI